MDRDSGWAGGKGAGLSPEYHRDCDIRGQQEEEKNNDTWMVWYFSYFGKFRDFVNFGKFGNFENFENFDVLR